MTASQSLHDNPVDEAAAVRGLPMPISYIKRLAQEFGDWAAVTAGTGLPASGPHGCAGPVTVAQTLRCVGNVLAFGARPGWHLRFAQRMAEHFHGPVTIAWLSAPTLGDGLDVYVRYMPSRVPYFHWQSFDEAGRFRCELTELIDFGPTRAAFVEIPLLVMHEYVQMHYFGPMDAARLELRYPRTEYVPEYSSVFRCPVEFDAPRNAFGIPAAWRAIENPDYDERTWNASLRRLEELYRLGRERVTLVAVRQSVFELIDAGMRGQAPPTLEKLADRMHMSSRTLIRRLRAMGTTYQAIVDEVQQQRARELLANANLRVHDIATALGYRDAASFTRSFRRWFGLTPAVWREQQGQRSG